MSRAALSSSPVRGSRGCDIQADVRRRSCGPARVPSTMPAMSDALDRATRSARELARRIGIDHHDVLVVLGSGLSGVAEILGAEEDWVPLDTLPYFPPYTVAGHRAHGWSMEVAGRRLLVLG